MESGKITIGFHYINEFGSEYKNESFLNVIYDESEMEVIERCLNNFLRQIGFYRPNDNIYLEDLSDDEYDAVHEFIREYREKSKQEQGELNEG